jgi:hypothetical protein
MTDWEAQVLDGPHKVKTQKQEEDEYYYNNSQHISW